TGFASFAAVAEMLTFVPWAFSYLLLMGDSPEIKKPSADGQGKKGLLLPDLAFQCGAVQPRVRLVAVSFAQLGRFKRHKGYSGLIPYLPCRINGQSVDINLQIVQLPGLPVQHILIDAVE
ncbi:hypothetical protein, partial [Xenorhabdus bovienii]|uniref:hypothetical protein n=1 Tax=Xenorhabdus bovienii TaxID=40576 RepID=UPI002E7A3945